MKGGGGAVTGETAHMTAAPHLRIADVTIFAGC